MVEFFSNDGGDIREMAENPAGGAEGSDVLEEFDAIEAQKMELGSS